MVDFDSRFNYSLNIANPKCFGGILPHWLFIARLSLIWFILDEVDKISLDPKCNQTLEED